MNLLLLSKVLFIVLCLISFFVVCQSNSNSILFQRLNYCPAFIYHHVRQNFISRKPQCNQIKINLFNPSNIKAKERRFPLWGKGSPEIVDDDKYTMRKNKLLASELNKIIHHTSGIHFRIPIRQEIRMFIKISDVDVTYNSESVLCLVSILGNTIDRREGFSWIVSNAKQIRHELSQKLKWMKRLPHLRFKLDSISDTSNINLMHHIDSEVQKMQESLDQEPILNEIEEYASSIGLDDDYLKKPGQLEKEMEPHYDDNYKSDNSNSLSSRSSIQNRKSNNNIGSFVPINPFNPAHDDRFDDKNDDFKDEDYYYDKYLQDEEDPDDYPMGTQISNNEIHDMTEEDDELLTRHEVHGNRWWDE